MREISKRGEQRHKVLVTVDQTEDGSLKAIADQLAACGLDDVELFQLGGVIAGEARGADLASMRRVPGVASIETDYPLRSF